MYDSKGAKIMVNDALYVKNFKGFNNIGESAAGNLGLVNFVQSSFKISQINCPLLSDYNVEPFVYGNWIKARNNGNNSISSEKPKSSFGIGLSGQYNSAAVELYYTLWSNKQLGDKSNGW